LLQDKRNFIRNPPASSQFFFDYDVNYPVALVMLSEDPDLQMMRFELVPKQCVNLLYILHEAYYHVVRFSPLVN